MIEIMLVRWRKNNLLIDKKLGIWICASIVSLSVLSTTIIWAKTYYDVKADVVAVKEAAKDKKVAIGESFDRARKATRGAFDKLTIASLLEDAQRDQRMCVVRTEVDMEHAFCGPHVFETAKACRDFEEWLHSVDWHGKNIYLCQDAEKIEKCESASNDNSVSASCISRKLGEE